MLIAAVAAVVFGNTLTNEFVWDDKLFLVSKSVYRRFDLHNILFTPYNPANGVEYLPVRDLSYILDYSIWGLGEFGYHLTNLILYILTAFLIHRFTFRLVECLEERHGASVGPSSRGMLPLLTALLFVTHPIHSQAVAFVTQRNTLLSGLFFFAALLLYLRYLRGLKATARLGILILAFICCLLAFFSKGTSIILPLMMALVLANSTRNRVAGEWFTLVPFFLASLLTAWLFSDIARHTGFMNANPMDFGAYSPLVRLARALQIPWFYLSNLLLPTQLAPEYKVLFGSFFTQLPVIFSAGALAVAIAFAVRVRKSLPLVLFSVAWYVIALLPVLNLLPTYPVVADRYAFLPSFGFCLLLAYILVEVPGSRIRLKVTVSVCLLLFWAVLSFRENRIWRDDRTLYEAMIAREPELARGYARLGYVCLQAGQREDALGLFRKAADMDPSLPDFECQMGSRALKNGDYQGAAEWFDRGLMRKDTHIVSLFLCGVAHMKSNDLLKASGYFMRVLSSPDADINSLKQQARLGLEQIVKPFAEERAQALLSKEPSDMQLHEALAHLYHSYHLYEEALRELDALPKPPGFDENLMRAGMYADLGRFDRALEQYALCLKEKPEDQQALYGAGRIYQRRRKFAEALACYGRVPDNNPHRADVLFEESVIYFLTGDNGNSRAGFGALRQHPQLKWRVAAYERKLDEL